MQAWLRAERLGDMTQDKPTRRSWIGALARRLDHMVASGGSRTLMDAHNHPWGETGKKLSHRAISATLELDEIHCEAA